jgi:flagellar motor switch protein FliN/FliY
VEDLRATFPGEWRFAAFCDSVRDRSGFLALDPLLAGRLFARLTPGREVRRDWLQAESGEGGGVAWLLASGLEQLAAEEPWSSWRFYGLLRSTSALGRACLDEDILVGSWLTVAAGWDEGFAVWLEPGSSVRRRAPMPAPGSACLRPLRGLRLALALEAGSTALSRDALDGLRPGDVILLERGGPETCVHVRLGPLRIRASVDQHRLRVERLDFDPGNGGEHMESVQIVQEGAGPGLEAAEVGRLPVRLTAETGRVELTVAQLMELKEGDVLAFPEDLMAPVDLRAAGRLLARGELVDVDGRRGVRLLEVVLQPGGGDEDLA